MVLRADIGGQAVAAAAVIHADRIHGEFAFLAVDRGVAVAVRDVDAHAGAAILAEAAAQVDGAVALAAGLDAHGHFAQLLVRRALGRMLIEPPMLPRRRRAVDEAVRAAQHLDPLHQLGRHELARQQAVQPL
ncbi:hypothetical protein ACFOHT_27340 [Massilia oculi]|uniref:hypothetical protein n=1 Tax=Massilia oculi TaxID=945844 RepID=UPI00361333AB